MRIAHLSDIHLSSSNYRKFINYYRNILLNDLFDFHRKKNIELVVITGDLVDKGGDSLLRIPEIKEQGFTDPYEVFRKTFIDPICDKLSIPAKQILFIPGNHDVDEKTILLYEEREILKNLSAQTSSKYLHENIKDFKHSKRIEKFKAFEKRFHNGVDEYLYSENQSSFFYQSQDGQKIGFILVNDSWRCKGEANMLMIEENNPKNKLIVGEQQIYSAAHSLETFDTDFTLCLLHHSLENYLDDYEVDKALKRCNVSMVLNGHYHRIAIKAPREESNDYLMLRCKASLNSPDEKHVNFIPGYQLLDIEHGVLTKIHYRMYNEDHDKFSPDAHNSGHDSGVDETGYKLCDNESLDTYDQNKFM